MVKGDKKIKLQYLLLLLNTNNLIFSLSTRLLDLVPNFGILFAKNTDLSRWGLLPEEIAKLKNPT
ncbi:MAG: hypothetical protein LBL17_02605 [Coxiellaceae bacterium]|jgi:hypothetical protein|nr:hypothetical protein [Coxiellaceae bacterium]